MGTIHNLMSTEEWEEMYENYEELKDLVDLYDSSYGLTKAHRLQQLQQRIAEIRASNNDTNR